VAFTINTNIASMQAQEYLRVTQEFQSKTISRVTSGLRIVSSGDDAAGLAIANGFRSDQAVLTQGIRNANDGLATLQTIDSGINNISKLLDRARTLATQSASGTFNGNREVLNSEFQSVIQEINRQAQAIGLNQGGDFAKNLSVFIGGGRGGNDAEIISNGSVSVDLRQSTVDARSLGLSGYSASSSATYDMSKYDPSVSNSDLYEAIGGATTMTFNLSGVGFDDQTITVNLTGVQDLKGLVAAINAGIEGAAGGTSPGAVALRNANIQAQINADGKGFSLVSSSAAFVVEAGNRPGRPADVRPHRRRQRQGRWRTRGALVRLHSCRIWRNPADHDYSHRRGRLAAIGQRGPGRHYRCRRECGCRRDQSRLAQQQQGWPDEDRRRRGR
jgi:flagellin